MNVTSAGGATVTGGAGLDELTVLGTSSADTLAVNEKQVRLNSSNSDTVSFSTIETLLVEALEGADKIDVNATIASTTINAGVGDDLVRVGSRMPSTGGNVNSMVGALIVNGQAGDDAMSVDETGENASENGTLTADRLTGFGMGTSGLAYSSVESLEIGLGSGDDRLSISSASAPTKVSSGKGNDTLVASSTVTVALQLIGDAGND